MYPDPKSKSAMLFERAQAVLPGGNSRHSIAFAPYPLYAVRGEGCRVWDADGRAYIDCIQNMSANVHGHRHPEILAAVEAQLSRLISAGMPTEVEIELAESLCARVPSVEMVRFANSGTEALMFAMRAARAFTGRRKLAKIEGGYHGSYDGLDLSTRPPASAWGPADAPATVAEGEGFTEAAVADTIIRPANRTEEARAILERHAEDLAAVVIDPLISRMGFLPLRPDYLKMVREVTAASGTVLVFDEVFSFRLGLAGAQGEAGVNPDLSTFGKLIGGGFPIGAVGGRGDMMDVFNHLPRGRPRVEHSGTFNANPVSMAAGLAALRLLDGPALQRLNGLGDMLRSGLRGILDELGLPGQVQGGGSLTSVLPHDKLLTDYRSFAQALAGSTFPGRWADIHARMINHGVLPVFPCAFILSTPMTEDDIGEALEAARASLGVFAQGVAA